MHFLYLAAKYSVKSLTSDDFPQTQYRNNSSTSSSVLPPVLITKNFFFPYSIFGPNPEDSSVAYHTIIYSLLISNLAQCNLMKIIYIETGNVHCLLTVPIGVHSCRPAEFKWNPRNHPNHRIEHIKKISVGNNLQAATCTTMYRFILDKSKSVKRIKRSSYSLWTSGS